MGVKVLKIKVVDVFVMFKIGKVVFDCLLNYFYVLSNRVFIVIERGVVFESDDEFIVIVLIKREWLFFVYKIINFDVGDMGV